MMPALNCPALARQFVAHAPVNRAPALPAERRGNAAGGDDGNFERSGLLLPGQRFAGWGAGVGLALAEFMTIDKNV
jgi:hypothetical protein